MNQVFHHPKVRKHTRLGAYKTLARPIETYGSKALAIRKQDEQRLATAEMKFIRTAGYYSLLDRMRNEHILVEYIKANVCVCLYVQD
jgi:hypothetical protein